ncbi:MAG: GDP-L-fucose synthase [Planctomycetia bacterium]|nr:GDP-L-fucose synthase [Planctomycetia bacterium]
MERDARIYVAGHTGLVGSAICRHLAGRGHTNVITRRHADLDLTDQFAVVRFFEETRPEYVFLCAAKVGGIAANARYPGQFIHQNLAIQTNVLTAACDAGVTRLLFLGSSCIYPRECPQPIREEYLLTGPLEPTNRPYAVAKIAGIEMCWSYNREYGTRFVALMPTNLYGPGDNYDLDTSHVVPALIRKMHEAKEAGAPQVTVWGSGTPRRELLHADDLADAAVFVMTLDDRRAERIAASDDAPPLVNVGCGSDLTIRELVTLIRRIVGYEGEVVWDATKPDGTPRKLLDIGRIESLGWKPRIGLEEGLRRTYREFVAAHEAGGDVRAGGRSSLAAVKPR